MAGFVIGLFVYAPTAVFAMLQLGVPAAVADGVLRLLAGLVGRALCRSRLPRIGETPCKVPEAGADRFGAASL